MKRLLQHLLYWLTYILFGVFIEYLWVKRLLPDVDTAELVTGMLFTNSFTAIPDMLFTYYLLYVGYKALMNGKAPRYITVACIVAAAAFSVFLSRAASYYILEHVSYGGKLGGDALLDPSLLLRSFIFLGFCAGPALSLRLFRKQLAAKEREKQLIEDKLRTELKLLRNQLHPHFLFNTLNNIYALARKQSAHTPDAILKLSDLLSFMLYKSDSDTIALAQEVEFLEDYIALERVRYSDRLSLKFYKDVSDETVQVVPLLLLPLVENAFKHGASEMRFNAYIHISLKQQGPTLLFSIENNFDSDTAIANKGNIGLQNLRKQLLLLYKEHQIDIADTNNIFKVVLNINLDTYGQA